MERYETCSEPGVYAESVKVWLGPDYTFPSEGMQMVRSRGEINYRVHTNPKKSFLGKKLKWYFSIKSKKHSAYFVLKIYNFVFYGQLGSKRERKGEMKSGG